MSGRSSKQKPVNVPEKDCIVFEEEMVIDKEVNKEPANWVDQVDMLRRNRGTDELGGSSWEVMGRRGAGHDNWK